MTDALLICAGVYIVGAFVTSFITAGEPGARSLQNAAGWPFLLAVSMARWGRDLLRER